MLVLLLATKRAAGTCEIILWVYGKGYLCSGDYDDVMRVLLSYAYRNTMFYMGMYLFISIAMVYLSLLELKRRMDEGECLIFFLFFF